MACERMGFRAEAYREISDIACVGSHLPVTMRGRTPARSYVKTLRAKTSVFRKLWVDPSETFKEPNQ